MAVHPLFTGCERNVDQWGNYVAFISPGILIILLPIRSCMPAIPFAHPQEKQLQLTHSLTFLAFHSVQTWDLSSLGNLKQRWRVTSTTTTTPQLFSTRQHLPLLKPHNSNWTVDLRYPVSNTKYASCGHWLHRVDDCGSSTPFSNISVPALRIVHIILSSSSLTTRSSSSSEFRNVIHWFAYFIAHMWY